MSYGNEADAVEANSELFIELADAIVDYLKDRNLQFNSDKLKIEASCDLKFRIINKIKGRDYEYKFNNYN